MYEGDKFELRFKVKNVGLKGGEFAIYTYDHEGKVVPSFCRGFLPPRRENWFPSRPPIDAPPVRPGEDESEYEWHSKVYNAERRDFDDEIHFRFLVRKRPKPLSLLALLAALAVAAPLLAVAAPERE